MIRRAASVGAAVLLIGASTPDSIDADFDAFFRAGTRGAAEKAAERLIKDGVAFDTALARLKKGRAYGKASTGRRVERQNVDGASFENTIDIPDDYDPSRSWTVRVQLHGGIGRPEPQEPPRQRQTASAAKVRSTSFLRAGPTRRGGMRTRSTTSSRSSIA